MRTRISSPFALATALVLTLAACGDSEPDVEPADVVLGAALDDLREAGTGAFGFVLGDEVDAALRTEGTYDLWRATSRFTVSTDDGDTQASITQVAHAGEMWMQVAENEGQACWLHVEEEIGTPAYVEVALAAEAEEWVDPGIVMRGTVDLGLLVNTLGAAAGDLELEAGTNARAEILLLVDDGTLTGWRTDMASVLEAVRDTGVELTDEMVQMIKTDVDVQMLAWFADPGAEVNHAAPKKASVVKVDADDPDGIEAAVARCTAA